MRTIQLHCKLVTELRDKEGGGLGAVATLVPELRTHRVKGKYSRHNYGAYIAAIRDLVSDKRELT